MKNIKIENLFVYIVPISVLIVSFLFAYLLPINDIFKGIVAIPGIGAMCLSLYKSWKDEQLQNKQQDFILGTSSHVANVVYDKHVDFCEEYVARIQKGFQELLKEGASRNAMHIGRELVNIRQKHSTWLTKEIEKNLRPFEHALISIGTKNGLIDHLPIGEERNKVIDEVYKFFGLIMGHDKAKKEEEAQISIEQIIEYIREILGVNTFTKLRLKASELALNRLNR